MFFLGIFGISGGRNMELSPANFDVGGKCVVHFSLLGFLFSYSRVNTYKDEYALIRTNVYTNE